MSVGEGGELYLCEEVGGEEQLAADIQKRRPGLSPILQYYLLVQLVSMCFILFFNHFIGRYLLNNLAALFSGLYSAYFIVWYSFL